MTMTNFLRYYYLIFIMTQTMTDFEISYHASVWVPSWGHTNDVFFLIPYSSHCNSNKTHIEIESSQTSHCWFVSFKFIVRCQRHGACHKVVCIRPCRNALRRCLYLRSPGDNIENLRYHGQKCQKRRFCFYPWLWTWGSRGLCQEGSHPCFWGYR